MNRPAKQTAQTNISASKIKVAGGKFIPFADVKLVLNVILEEFNKNNINKESDAYCLAQEVINNIDNYLSAVKKGKDIDFEKELKTAVKETEKAANEILDICNYCLNVTSNITDENIKNELNNSMHSIMTSCSFQDLTGQRINKSLNFLNEKNIMESISENKFMSKEEKLKEGPQAEGKGMSQADIDNLFD